MQIRRTERRVYSGFLENGGSVQQDAPGRRAAVARRDTVTETPVVPDGAHRTRDGLKEQTILLGRIARELDDYFSLRTLPGNG